MLTSVALRPAQNAARPTRGPCSGRLLAINRHFVWFGRISFVATILASLAPWRRQEGEISVEHFLAQSPRALELPVLLGPSCRLPRPRVAFDIIGDGTWPTRVQFATLAVFVFWRMILSDVHPAQSRGQAYVACTSTNRPLGIQIGNPIPHSGCLQRTRWEVVDVLAGEGILGGLYGGRERQMATDRHARVAEATHCSNRGAYLRAENVPDDPPFNGDGIQMDCRPGGEIQIDGYLDPGHVSTIIGTRPYEVLGVPQVVAGFEPTDVLAAVLRLLVLIKKGKNVVENQYTRLVRTEGNPIAMKFLDEVFDVGDSEWRGLGNIPGSGFKLKPEFDEQNAEVIYKDILDKVDARELNPACKCAEVLRGLRRPDECPLFDRSCTPTSPQGPCMVSMEGSCGIAYEFRDV